MVRALLEASEMVVRYGDKMALDRVSLEIFRVKRWLSLVLLAVENQRLHERCCDCTLLMVARFISRVKIGSHQRFGPS